MKKIYDTVICGAGPAGMAGIIHSDANGNLNSYLNQGICVIEKQESLLIGALQQYDISANSKGKALFEFITEKSEIKPFLEKQESLFPLILNLRNQVPNLKEISDIYKVIGDFYAKKISNNTHCLLNLNSNVKSISVKESDLFEVRYEQLGEEKVVYGRNVHINLGGRIRDGIKTIPKDKWIHAEEIFNNKKEVISLLKNLQRNVKIGIVGNSHSAMSTISKLNSKLNIFNNSKFMITILGKSELKLYYDSIENAMRDNYKFDLKNDICPLTNRVNRFSGMREESCEIAKNILNNVYNNINLVNEHFESQDEFFDLLIDCRGYKTNQISIYNQNNIEIVFKKENDIIKTDDFFRPIQFNGDILKGCYMYGLGIGIPLGTSSGGEKSFMKKIDGIWMYQFHVIPEINKLKNSEYVNKI